MISGVLLDLSGVLYVGGKALPGAHDALQKLNTAGLPVKFVTNTTRSTRDMILSQLAAMRFDVAADDLFTASQAALTYLDQHKLNPYLLVHPNLLAEFLTVPPGVENAVLIGDAADNFTYQNLNRAFRLVLEGAPLLAMGYNRYFKQADGFSLDCGPFVAALEFAADTKATVLGKPSSTFFHSALAEFDCPVDEIVMVGDDVEADVCGAVTAGLQGLLVRTGKYRAVDESMIDQSDAQVVDDIGAAVEWILLRCR